MNLSLIGLQWGDEGKGKIIDFLTNFCDLNIRYNGGHNAGHIIYINNLKKKIRILPSGIFKQNCLCILSDNVIVLLENLIFELKKINNNLIISKNIFIINKIDEFLDVLLDKINKIGTTGSGISVIYLRKHFKCSFNIRDIYKIYFLKKIKKNIFFYNFFFFFFNLKIKINYLFFFLKLKKLIINIKKIIINNNCFINNNIFKLFESSQGALLDFDKGTYPYITNSNIINKSIFINSNFYLNNIKFIAIVKSYSTRVGNGFFISKIHKKKNFFFSLINKEFGSNSLRIRSSGWLDIISLIEMIKLNNISNLIITKMDSFLFLKYIKILINYKLEKKFFDYKNNIIYKKNYKKFFSWSFIKKKYFLNNKNFHLYIRFLEKILNTPISIISIGKHKNDLIIL